MHIFQYACWILFPCWCAVWCLSKMLECLCVEPCCFLLGSCLTVFSILDLKLSSSSIEFFKSKETLDFQKGNVFSPTVGNRAASFSIGCLFTHFQWLMPGTNPLISMSPALLFFYFLRSPGIIKSIFYFSEHAQILRKNWWAFTLR